MNKSIKYETWKPEFGDSVITEGGFSGRVVNVGNGGTPYRLFNLNGNDMGNYALRELKPDPAAPLDSVNITDSGFEVWLKTTCFQKPTKEAYNLAKSVWLHFSKPTKVNIKEVLEVIKNCQRETATNYVGYIKEEKLVEELKALANK